jgi:hypothetical protein
MMLCLFGLQVLAVGLVGELLMRTHYESRENTVYRIEHVFGANARPDSSGAPAEKSLAAKRAVR